MLFNIDIEGRWNDQLINDDKYTFSPLISVHDCRLVHERGQKKGWKITGL